MRMKDKQVKLKNGADAVLKSVGEGEADQVIAFINKVCSETDFVALTPQEASALNKKQQQEVIANYDKAKKGIMLAAYVGGEMVANCTVTAPAYVKESHRAELELTVCTAFRNNGIGSALLNSALDFAQKVGYEQIELNAVTQNLEALLLCKKFGFDAVGSFPRAVKLADGQYRDYIRFVKNFKNEA